MVRYFFAWTPLVFVVGTAVLLSVTGSTIVGAGAFVCIPDWCWVPWSQDRGARPPLASA